MTNIKKKFSSAFTIVELSIVVVVVVLADITVVVQLWAVRTSIGLEQR